MFYCREHCDSLERYGSYLVRDYNDTTYQQKRTIRLLKDTQVSI